MNETAIMIGTLLAPLAASWAVSRAFTGSYRALALLPLAMFVLNALLVLTDLTCATGTGGMPWTQCSVPGLAALSNALAPLYSLNLFAILALTPALLILAGIAAMVCKEDHKS